MRADEIKVSGSDVGDAQPGPPPPCLAAGCSWGFARRDEDGMKDDEGIVPSSAWLRQKGLMVARQRRDEPYPPSARKNGTTGKWWWIVTGLRPNEGLRALATNAPLGRGFLPFATTIPRLEFGRRNKVGEGVQEAKGGGGRTSGEKAQQRGGRVSLLGENCEMSEMEIRVGKWEERKAAGCGVWVCVCVCVRARGGVCARTRMYVCMYVCVWCVCVRVRVCVCGVSLE
jgi:hypothetical protein